MRVRSREDNMSAVFSSFTQQLSIYAIPHRTLDEMNDRATL